MLFIHSLLSVSTSLSFPPSPLSSLGPFPTISFPHALDPCFAILILLSRFILRLCSFTHFSPTSSVSIPRVFPLRLLPPSHSRGKTRAAAALRGERGSTTSSQEPGGRWCKWLSCRDGRICSASYRSSCGLRPLTLARHGAEVGRCRRRPRPGETRSPGTVNWSVFSPILFYPPLSSDKTT